MHIVGTNLNLKRLPLRPYYSSMQGLIHVGLRHSYIVLKPAWNRHIHLVYYTEGGITVLEAVHYYSDCKYIINLVKGFILIYHFLVNAEIMLNPASDSSFYSCCLNVLSHFLFYRLYKFTFFKGFFSDFFIQILVYIRMKVFQG